METKDTFSVPDRSNCGAERSRKKPWKEWFSARCLVFGLDKNVTHLLPIVLFIASILLFSHGLQWPFYHPDEYKISHWVSVVEKNGFIPDDAYPQGMFRLVLGCKAIEDFAEKVKEMAENYGITPEELIEAYGSIEVVKYDMKMHRALEILKESNK